MSLILSFVSTALVLAAAGVRPAPTSEPPLPRTQTRPLECFGPDDAPADQHLVFRCAARPGMTVTTVLLHYRQGTEDFTPAPTLRTRAGWYVATLCPHMLLAGPLHYYVEARDVRGAVVATAGDDENPAVLRVQAAALAGGAVSAAATTRRPAPSEQAIAVDEDPLAPLRASREAARLAAIRRGPGTLFIGLLGGLGYGWFPARALDFRTDVQVSSGVGAAGPLVLSPEIGYQLTQALALSIEARLELIQVRGSGDAHPGTPASGAWAVLGRVSRHWGRARARLVASAAAGAGDGFRVVVAPTAGMEVAVSRTDSVRGGPLVLGPGIGFLYHFGPHFTYRAELRMLAGLPDFAAAVDLTTGVQVAF